MKSLCLLQSACLICSRTSRCGTMSKRPIYSTKFVGIWHNSPDLRILKDKSEKGHAAVIFKAHYKCSVDFQKLLFQSYDLAAGISGKYKSC